VHAVPGEVIYLQDAAWGIVVNTRSTEPFAVGDRVEASGFLEHARPAAIREGAEQVELVVGDSGPGWAGGGIDDQLLTSSKPEGTGVGLFVVRTAVENHRGTLEVGRSPLGGAEFRIRLPRQSPRAWPPHADQPTGS
jgi:nitrogen-specific signal transduction histidine kinase